MPYDWIARISGMPHEHIHTGFHDHDDMATKTNGKVTSSMVREFRKRMQEEY